MWGRRLAIAALSATFLGCAPSTEDEADEAALDEGAGDELAYDAAEPVAGVAPVDTAPSAEAPAGEDWEAAIRPTEVRAVILSGPNAGEFHSSGIHRLCGRMATAGTHSWTIDSPYGDVQINSVSFGAEHLIFDDVTTKFHLGIVVVKPDGSSPPAYVVNAGSGETGTAKLTIEGRSALLELEGVNAMNERIDLRVSCGPKV
ncbi:MAG TPA: hypothetical protein VD701_04650 [Steroidobacteraceae bacterium]|nr:hypothetical protein [Steroidobacteraceae bacterium]